MFETHMNNMYKTYGKNMFETHGQDIFSSLKFNVWFFVFIKIIMLFLFELQSNQIKTTTYVFMSTT